MFRYIALLIAALALMLLPSGIAYAETTNLRLQILPEDCVFEVVDSGTQQLRYLTPELCGVIIERPTDQPLIPIGQPSQPIYISDLPLSVPYRAEAPVDTDDVIEGPLSQENTNIFVLRIAPIGLRIEIPWAALWLGGLVVLALFLSRRQK